MGHGYDTVHTPSDKRQKEGIKSQQAATIARELSQACHPLSITSQQKSSTLLTCSAAKPHPTHLWTFSLATASGAPAAMLWPALAGKGGPRGSEEKGGLRAAKCGARGWVTPAAAHADVRCRGNGNCEGKQKPAPQPSHRPTYLVPQGGPVLHFDAALHQRPLQLIPAGGQYIGGHAVAHTLQHYKQAVSMDRDVDSASMQ